MTRFDGGILAGLDEAALAVLFDVGVRERVESGTRLVHEGEAGGDVWLLLNGKCDVDVRGEHIATLGPGQLFGEITALAGGTRTASVTSAESCELLRFTPDALASAMARSTGLMSHLLHTLASRSRSMTTREDAVRDEHRELRRLEHAMLPDPAVFEGSGRFHHEVHWRPFTYASGDYCDVLRLDDSTYMIALGDVLGHGAATSLTIGAARGQMRELAIQGLPPEAILPRLDRHLADHGPPGLHVTIVLALLDGKASTLRVATAGHPAPFLFRAGKATQLSIEPGPLLGYGLALGDYPSLDVDLKPKDRVLLFTDGVSEVRYGDDADMIGEDGLLRLFEQTCLEQDEDVLDGVVSRIKALPGARPPDDDATMFLLRDD